jgi:enamine deaminase RidA (YjgF/YER057c/UK114 family)
MEIERINPKGLFVLDAFTQIVRTKGGRLAFIAGQGAFDEQFNLIGAGDLHAQVVQAFKNLQTAVQAIGGSVEQIVSTNMYIVGLDPKKVEIFQRAMAVALDGKPFPPNASTMIGVQSLAGEGMLVEISGFAIVD